MVGSVSGKFPSRGSAAVGLLLGIVGLCVGMVLNGAPPAHAQAGGLGGGPPAAAAMTVLRLDADDAGDHVIVVDPATKVMSTYYVSRESGKMTLRSVRNLTWDLQLEDFNPTTPSPKDIRAVIQRLE